MVATRISTDQGWRSLIRGFVLAAVIFILPLISHAGGLGMAPLAAIVGLTGYATLPQVEWQFKPATWQIALFVFLAWATVTSFWSPYTDDQVLINPIKIIFGAVIYLGAFHLIRHLTHEQMTRVARMLLISLALILVLLAIDVFSNYRMTIMVDPVDLAKETPRMKRIQTNMNLGHSVVILLMLAPLGRIYFNRVFPGFNWVNHLALGLIFVVGLVGGFNVAILAVPLWILVYSVPDLWVKNLLSLLFTVAILALILAPLGGAMMTAIPADFRLTLPASWDHRIEMWGYTFQQIMERPFLGHGFDAARVFDATYTNKDGYDMRIISLHPHNFGLQLWLETGLIGALLAAASVFQIRKKVLTYVGRSVNRTRMIAALMVVVLVTGTVSYGVWQEWFWATLILSFALYGLEKRLSPKPVNDPE